MRAHIEAVKRSLALADQRGEPFVCATVELRREDLRAVLAEVKWAEAIEANLRASLREVQRERDVARDQLAVETEEVERITAVQQTQEDRARELIEEAEANLAEAEASAIKSRDWYQQRFDRLRRWVTEEVAPLSQEVAHGYFSIVANGATSPHEPADWTSTLHGQTLRANRAEAALRQLREDRTQLAERVAGAALRHFIDLRRPDEPYGAADWSRAEYCIRLALAKEAKP